MAKATKKTKEDIQNMSEGELTKKLLSIREEMRLMLWKAEGARSKNVKEYSNLKKQVARILTEINKKK